MKNTPKQSLINFFRFSSLKTTIMGLFLPVIVIFVILIGFLSYWIAAGQIRKSTYINISDMVAQDANYLNERLGATFEQLEALQNDIDTLTIIQHLDGREYGTFIPEDYVTMDHSLKKIFLTYNSMFDSLLVDFNDGKFFLYENDRWATKINFSYADWRTHFTNSPSDYYWWNLHRDPIFICPGSQERVISLFKLYGNPMTKVKGIILFNLRADFFREVLNKVQISKNGYLMIFSNDGTMVFKNVAPYARVDSHRILKLIGDNPAGTLWIRSQSGRKMTVIYNTIRINRWKIAAIFPESEILNRTNFIKYLTLSVTIFLIVFALFLSNTLAKIITRPMARLTEKVKLVEKGDLDVPFDINLENEIGVLNQGIGRLLNRVKKLLEQIKAEKEQKRLADLAVLQAQINPHFLYNTLDSIKHLCDMGENKDASRMVAALARLYRIGLGGGKRIITIQEEMEHIQSYLVIQQMRYVDKFEYQIMVDPEIYRFSIVKLTLQPLVENAIYHGIKQSHGKCWVQIRGFRQDQEIYLEVIDNGAGMSQEKVQQIHDTLWEHSRHEDMGFGLSNVQQRIQLHYGSAYGLHIQSTVGGGTTIRVIIPAEKGDEKNVPYSHR